MLSSAFPLTVSLLFLFQSSDAAVHRAIDDFRSRMAAQRQREAETEPTITAGQLGDEDRRRMADGRPLAVPVAQQPELPAREALLTQPTTAGQPDLRLLVAEIPDPTDAPRQFEERAAELARSSREPRVTANYRKVIEYALQLLGRLNRPQKLPLSLAECLRRAVEHNYSVRIEGFNPAIDQSQLVAAEAAFDAVFFLDSSWVNEDPAKINDLELLQSDLRIYEGGIRKLLPTGMQVSTSLRQRRSYLQALEFEKAATNPAWNTDFVATLRQPLLRGFGLDYNRRQIELARLARDQSQQAYMQRVRDTLFDVETAYWQLVQARRTVSVLAESVAQNYVTYKSIEDRQRHDATPVELANSQSRWQSREVEYLESIKNVRDAEDALKNLLNDPALKLSDTIEIVPTESFFLAPIAIDHFAEVRTALDYRNEIEQAKLTIDQARVQTAAAKNETLPQLDLTFQYEVHGLENSADASFDNTTTNRFRSYTVAVSFSYPIGNRGPRANLQRARHQESQTLVALQRVTDLVVQEVNNAVRTLQVRFEQIPPQFGSVESAARNLRALQARTQRIDPNYLETELSAVEQLSNNRIRLLSILVDYNVAIVALEKAKGTLLRYNNVVIADEFPR